MRRSYAGAAKKAQLTEILNGTTAALTIECDDLSNYPTGSSGPFYIVVDRGQVTEEKILCESRTNNTITVYDTGLVSGRGADGTTVLSHSIGAEVEHVFTATDADEANAHVNAVSDVHGATGDVVGTTGAQTLSDKTLENTTFTGTINGITEIPHPLLLMGG